MSGSLRPTKRQRTHKNMFLDLEAVAGDGSDDEYEEIYEEFITEEAAVEDTDDHGSHAQLWQSMKAEEDDNWQERLEQTNSRHRPHRHNQNDSEEPFYQLKETDMLWEIGCKVGSEERAIFQILRKSMHPTMPQALATSALATSMPGRIYVEVSSFAQATKLAQAIPGLKPSCISPVPRDELYRILNISSTRLKPYQWARVAGKGGRWRWYKGDTGLVLAIQGSEKLYLALIPRVAITEADQEKADQKLYRPPQARAERLHLANTKGEKSIRDDIEGRYIWKGYTFSKEGFILIDLDKIEVVPLLEALPATTELSIFRTTTLIPPRVAQRTEDMIQQTQIKLGDRVKVVTGDYLGVIGEIIEILEDDSEVNIYMPSQDITQNVLKSDVRATYRVGDQVKVLDGEYKDLVGWVVSISPNSLRILNLEKQLEVNVLKADVEFHSPKHSISLKPRDEYPKWGKLGDRNPNDVYIGKRVMVITKNEMKGYRGVIKSTTPDGWAFVELDARLRQANLKIKLPGLIHLTDEDTPSYQTPSEKALPSSSSLRRTPVWDSSSPSIPDPAWNPSSQTPLHITRPTGPVHWLDDPAWDLFSNKPLDEFFNTRHSATTASAVQQYITTAIPDGSSTPMPTESSATPAWSPSHTPLGINPSTSPVHSRHTPEIESQPVNRPVDRPPAPHVLLNDALVNVHLNVIVDGGTYTQKQLAVRIAYLDGWLGILYTWRSITRRLPSEWVTPKYPNAGYDNALLIVIKGEHCGKYVRRVQHRHTSSVSFMTLVVIDYTEDFTELLTEEILELKTGSLCIVHQPDNVKARNKDLTQALRNSYRKKHHS